ncbi:MAG: hypothetical protein JKY61_12640 [Planctomycetes bacterium]|nr:hypothetical protein [Planctomycetota bacterium]
MFDLPDFKAANTCYAWEEGRGPRAFAVLGVPPINSAADAVRASIVQRRREAQH